MGKEGQQRKEGSDDDGSEAGSSTHGDELRADASPAGEQSDEGDESNSNEPQSSGLATDTNQQSTADDETAPKKTKKVRKLKLSATADFNAKLQKRGIVYLSRVPPRMGPAKVKTLLADFGTITRIYLVEEDKTRRKKRKKAGGSSGKRYNEGWIEFESKKIARLVGETLNQTRVTNHKGSIHYDDMWSVKYLRGFKWSHLTEKVAYERRVREQKLRVEMMEVRRENASYVAQVEAGKRMDHIEDRMKKRQMKEGGSSGGGGGDNGMSRKKRKIRQKKPFEGDRSSTKSAILGSLV